MSNQGKRWTKEDKAKLLKIVRSWNASLSDADTLYLNLKFKRSLTRKSWARFIRDVRAEHGNMSGVVNGLNDTLGDAYTIDYGNGTLNITFDDTEPRCKNCKFWHFLHHKTDEDHEVFVTIGDCRIRSVNADYFPERESDEHCGDHEWKGGS